MFKPIFSLLLCAFLVTGSMAQESVRDDVPFDQARRPGEYPMFLSVKEVRAFIKTLDMHSIGCGPPYSTGYDYMQNGDMKIQTPWVRGKVGVSETFTSIGAPAPFPKFPYMINLGRHVYAQERPDDKYLRWQYDLSKRKP